MVPRLRPSQDAAADFFPPPFAWIPAYAALFYMLYRISQIAPSVDNLGAREKTSLAPILLALRSDVNI